MKIIEEAKLKKIIEQFNIYKEKNKGDDFYNNLDKLKVGSLQQFSFKNDDAFFDQIGFILSVISSIIARPFISNRGEDVVIRAELAGHIPPSAFQDVFKDSQLWKEKDLDMVPEYVHYYQYTDELRIYENLFIGMLIRMLDNELSKYREFYISLLPTLDRDFETYLDNKFTEKALKKIDLLQRKLRFIKNTYFFKEVSKGNLKFKSVQPTNILMKNRLYNLCYKFYKGLITYTDQNELMNDLKTYYSLQILKVFKAKGFELNSDERSVVRKYGFKYNDYFVMLAYEDYAPEINLTIKLGRAIAKHTLKFDVSDNANDGLIQLENTNSLSLNVASIWSLVNAYNDYKPIFKNKMSEQELMTHWVESKFLEASVNKHLYSKFCPVCKSKNIDVKSGTYTCGECHSIYSFKSGLDRNKIWFLRYKR